MTYIDDSETIITILMSCTVALSFAYMIERASHKKVTKFSLILNFIVLAAALVLLSIQAVDIESSEDKVRDRIDLYEVADEFTECVYPTYTGVINIAPSLEEAETVKANLDQFEEFTIALLSVTAFVMVVVVVLQVLHCKNDNPDEGDEDLTNYVNERKGLVNDQA